MCSHMLQVRRIRYPITDEEDTWPGDATSSYAGADTALVHLFTETQVCIEKQSPGQLWLYIEDALCHAQRAGILIGGIHWTSSSHPDRSSGQR